MRKEDPPYRCGRRWDIQDSIPLLRASASREASGSASSTRSIWLHCGKWFRNLSEPLRQEHSQCGTFSGGGGRGCPLYISYSCPDIMYILGSFGGLFPHHFEIPGIASHPKREASLVETTLECMSLCYL